MAQLINLINQKFDKLLVIEKAPSVHRHTMWKCRCDCGNEIVVSAEYLRRKCKTVRDCGCSQKALKKIKEAQQWQKENYLAGKKFNYLTVIKNSGKSNNSGIIWICKCICGNEVEVSTSSLKAGHRKSCGCMRKIDITGQRFGKLVAMYSIPKPLNNQSGEFKWHCKCDCGNECEVTGYSLRSKVTQSCGCINYSIGERNIEIILKNNNIQFQSQYTENSLHKKRFDFAILDKDRIIRLVEFDGEQHYTDKKGLWNSTETLENIQQRDSLKNKWAKEHNIPLVRIPYWERDNITLDMILGDEYLVKE